MNGKSAPAPPRPPISDGPRVPQGPRRAMEIMNHMSNSEEPKVPPPPPPHLPDGPKVPKNSRQLILNAIQYSKPWPAQPPPPPPPMPDGPRVPPGPRRRMAAEYLSNAQNSKPPPPPPHLPDGPRNPGPRRLMADATRCSVSTEFFSANSFYSADYLDRYQDVTWQSEPSRLLAASGTRVLAVESISTTNKNVKSLHGIVSVLNGCMA